MPSYKRVQRDISIDLSVDYSLILMYICRGLDYQGNKMEYKSEKPVAELKGEWIVSDRVDSKSP